MKKGNENGQALVEFALIIPVLIMVIFAGFDFSRIIYEKTKLENVTNDCLSEMEKSNSYEETVKFLKKIDSTVTIEMKYKENNDMQVTLIKKLPIFTPGLNLILGNPYKIKAERVVNYETSQS